MIQSGDKPLGVQHHISPVAASNEQYQATCHEYALKPSGIRSHLPYAAAMTAA
jgi:hypothetical protein